MPPLGYDFFSDSGDPMDQNGHGTHCAGIIGAVHDDLGAHGVVPDALIMALKSLGFSNFGEFPFSEQSSRLHERCAQEFERMVRKDGVPPQPYNDFLCSPVSLEFSYVESKL